MAQAIMKLCGNCGREIGGREEYAIINSQPICRACHMPAAAGSATSPRDAGPPFKALGLTSLGQAWVVLLVGLLFSPAVVGIPMVAWGAIARSQILQERKRQRS